MALDSFHPFPFLPFEIRRMIYLLASPPRFVHVKEEHEDRDEFDERFITTPVQLELHPSIAYFACNWRRHVPWSFSAFRRWRSQWQQQVSLEAYGFNGPPTRHQPWEPTKEVPNIPHHFLADTPCVAWEFVRSGFFYSVAPIPTMLHVARESRQVLLDSGYELAFRTRTHGPRTWFNFKKDILYIGRVASFEENWDFHNLLSGNPMWDIGQYQPVDMKRVRRIALGEAGDHVSDNFDESVVEVSNILQLFPSVEELFLEEHGLQPLTKNFPKREGLNDDESWWHTSVVELDALSYLINDCVVCFAGYHNHHLKAYKENNMGDGSRYFVDAVSKFEEGLVRTRDRVVPSGAIAPWKIPEVRIVHIGYPWALRQLSDRRWATWNHVQNLRELEGRSKAIEEAHRSISVPNKLILDRDEEDNLPPSPFTVKYQDDLEAYDEYYMIPYHYDEEYETPRRRSSWVLQGTLAAPDQSP